MIFHGCRSRADDHHRLAVTAERRDQRTVFTRDRIGKHCQPRSCLSVIRYGRARNPVPGPEQPGRHSAVGGSCPLVGRREGFGLTESLDVAERGDQALMSPEGA
jgi:hypothetical protein